MKIGKYEVLETVKDGFIATLHKAFDPERKCEVALRTFECSDPEKVREFERAVRARAFLTHANIAQLVQIGDEGKTVYIATEWLDGEDVGRFVARRVLLPLEDKLDFILSICEGLAFAHDSSVIHCDLSPSKLFLMKSGAGKILDFGTSGFWSAQFCLAKRDRGPVTHSYRAPEQTAGRHYDARTDIFSAGLVFFEFLTGTRPVAPDHGGGMRIGESGSRLTHGAGLPDFLMEALQKAIALDPAERYQSASEMLVAFRKALDQVIRRRTELIDGVQSDCALISQFLIKLRDFFNTNWVQKRLSDAGVDSKLLELIQSDSSAGFAAGMQYLDITSLTDELDKTGNQLAEIDASIAELRRDVLDLHSRLPEMDAGQARQLVERTGDLFSSDPEAKPAMAEIRAQSLIKALNQAIAEGDLVSASRLLEEIEEAPPAQENLAHSVAAAKTKLADLAIREESLFKNAETAVNRLENAARSGSMEQIQSQLEDLQYQEKNLAAQYPSSDLAMKLVERSGAVRHQGSLALIQHACREAIKNRNIPAARESLRQFEKLCGNNPESEKALAQLGSEMAGLDERPDHKPSEAKKPQPIKKDEKQSLVVSQPSIRLDQQRMEEKAGALDGTETPSVKERKPRLMDSLPPTRLEAGTQKEPTSFPRLRIPLESSVKKEEKPGAEIPQSEPNQAPAAEEGKPEESGVTSPVDIEAIRANVAKLFEEDPEKCLGFLDTLESQLIEDPVIQSFQQKALEARKQRGAEIILTKPKKRSGLGLQGRGIACPVCGTLNPVDSKYCSQCFALIKDAKTVDVESDPGMKSSSAPATARVKRRLQTQPEATPAPRPKKAAGHGAAKYYVTALVAVVVLAVGGWLLLKSRRPGEPSTPKPPVEAEVIGTAITGVQAELREGTTIVGKLAKGIQLEVLRKAGASSPLTQDPDSLLDVRPTQPEDPKNPLTGSVKLRDLDHVVINEDKAFTAWHSFWLALDKFPDPQTTDPDKLKGHIRSVEERLRKFSGQNPPEALIEKLAGSYLSLAGRAKDPGDKTESCRLAKDHMKGLASKTLADVYIALCAEPTPPIQPPAASQRTCEDVNKDFENLYRKAGDLMDDKKNQEAIRVLQQILKPTACTGIRDKLKSVISLAQGRYDKYRGIKKSGKK